MKKILLILFFVFVGGYVNANHIRIEYTFDTADYVSPCNTGAIIDNVRLYYQYVGGFSSIETMGFLCDDLTYKIKTDRYDYNWDKFGVCYDNVRGYLYGCHRDYYLSNNISYIYIGGNNIDIMSDTVGYKKENVLFANSFMNFAIYKVGNNIYFRQKNINVDDKLVYTGANGTIFVMNDVIANSVDDTRIRWGVAMILSGTDYFTLVYKPLGDVEYSEYAQVIDGVVYDTTQAWCYNDGTTKKMCMYIDIMEQAVYIQVYSGDTIIVDGGIPIDDFWQDKIVNGFITVDGYNINITTNLYYNNYGGYDIVYDTFTLARILGSYDFTLGDYYNYYYGGGGDNNNIAEGIDTQEYIEYKKATRCATNTGYNTVKTNNTICEIEQTSGLLRCKAIGGLWEYYPGIGASNGSGYYIADPYELRIVDNNCNIINTGFLYVPTQTQGSVGDINDAVNLSLDAICDVDRSGDIGIGEAIACPVRYIKALGGLVVDNTKAAINNSIELVNSIAGIINTPQQENLRQAQTQLGTGTLAGEVKASMDGIMDNPLIGNLLLFVRFLLFIVLAIAIYFIIMNS